MSAIGKLVGSITGSDKAADAATTGAQISADAQREALAYLKQTEKLPQALREGALSTIGGLYGFGDIKPQDAVSAIKGSEIYKQILSSKAAGEDAILRGASVTGGLRSGNTNDALARYSGDLEQQGFFQGLGQLQGLAQLPSNANTIAATTANIGNTLAQGQVAAGQAIASGRGAFTSAALAGLGAFGAAGGFGGSSLGTGITSGVGGGGIGGGALGSGISFSDHGLKSNIQKISKKGGHNWYRWDWNDKAAKFGLHGSSEGVLAQEVLDRNPEAVGSRDGYLTVNYDALGLTQ